MELDEYLGHVDQFADEMDSRETIHEHYVPRLVGSQPAEDCVSFRLRLLTQEEINKLNGYREFGFFQNPAAPNPLRDIAWWAFCHDIIYAAGRRARERECLTYNPDQALFKATPRLFDAIRTRQSSDSSDYELIDETAVEHVAGEIYQFERYFSRLSPSLSPAIPALRSGGIRKSARFLRLDPHRSYPKSRQCFYRKLRLCRRTRTG